MIGNIYCDDGGVDCPGCKKHHDYAAVYARFSGSGDYATEFGFDCGCGHTIEVETESLPQFSCPAPTTPAADKEGK